MWSAMTENDEEPHRYVLLEDAVMVATVTKNGWRTRSTRADAHNHNYVSHESFADVMRWVDEECDRAMVTQCRAKVLECLQCEETARSSFLRVDTAEEAERALQHLERGW